MDSVVALVFSIVYIFLSVFVINMAGDRDRSKFGWWLVAFFLLSPPITMIVLLILGKKD